MSRALNVPAVVPIIGLVYLPLVAIHTKWDRNLRRHLLWLSPIWIFLLIIFFGPTTGSTTTASSLVTTLIAAVAGYSFYKSAKALVPLNFVSTPSLE